MLRMPDRLSHKVRQNSIPACPMFISNYSFLHTMTNDGEYIDPSNTRIMGSCTGLLAGVAASSSRGMANLPILGVTLVRLAFRIGVLVAATREWLQQGSSSEESWSTVMTGISEEAMEEILDKFHNNNVSPATIDMEIPHTDPSIDHATIKTSVY